VLAEVALESDAADPLLVGRVGPFDRRPGRVGGTVVDEDHLPLAAEAVERLDRAPGDLAGGAVLVVEGDHDRNLGRHTQSSLQSVYP
jgi:hypothetical protein